MISKLISKMLTAIDLVFMYPLYWTMHLLPRDRKRWVFIGWHRGETRETFADNTKYLFLYTYQHNIPIKAVWITKDKLLVEKLRKRGYEACYEYSFKGIWNMLRASIFVIDAYIHRHHFRFSGGAKVVQLLHGKGMKKKGYGKKILRHNDIVCVPSQFVHDALPDTFLKKSKVYITGYPRGDALLKDFPNADIGFPQNLRNQITNVQKNDQKIVWYAPTFRRGVGEFNVRKVLGPILEVRWLEENNIHLFISLHPKYTDQQTSMEGKRVHLITGDFDNIQFLRHVDLLITDYSSSFTDSLLLNRPIIFYPFDFEEYQKKEGVLLDYDELPGPKVRDSIQLQRTIESILKKDTYSEERAKTCDLYHRHKDGSACKRIVGKIIQLF